MNINRLTGREQKILVVCLILAAVYIGYSFVYKPILNQKNSLQQKIDKVKKRFSKNERILNEANSLKATYDQYLIELKQPDGNEQTVSKLISDVEKEATQIGLAISDMKPKPVKQEKYYNTFTLTLSLEGSWTDVLKLLHALQSKPYLFNVDEMNFDRASQRNTEFIRAYLVVSKIYIP